MTNQLPETISTRQAAKLLDASVRSIQLWADSGLLKAYKSPGGHRRITRTSVDELIASRQAATRGPASEIDQPDRLLLAVEALGKDWLVTRMREIAGGIGGGATLTTEYILAQIGRLNTLSRACGLDEPLRSGEQLEQTHILVAALVHTTASQGAEANV